MTMPEDSRNAWHVAGRSDELGERPLGRVLLDVPVVLFRGADGRPAALRDRCPHGLGPLSTGHVSGALLVCAYHGLRVDQRGECVDSRLSPEAREAAKVDSFALEERDGLLWIWLGDQSRIDRNRRG